MILHKVNFGPCSKNKRREAEYLVEQYLSSLLHNGQICDGHLIGTSQGSLIAYLHLAGAAGRSLKHHSKYGRDHLAKITEYFGQSPRWVRLDDDAPRTDATWKDAPFLYVFTHMFDWESPLRRGDNGLAVPLYLLPGKHEDREEIYFWQSSYHDHDSIWIGTGALEIPAYKQLADPASELSQNGIDICKMVEKATKVPTYYYLMRYWGRRKDEEDRACPGCGRAWRTKHASNRSDQFRFWHFEFQCHPCRLVSHLADADEDERHAFVGEYKKKSRRIEK